MNKIAKTALMTGTALCVAGVVLSTDILPGEKISHMLQIMCMYPEEILLLIKTLQL